MPVMLCARGAFIKRDLLLLTWTTAINAFKLLDVHRKFPELNEVLPADAYIAKDKMNMRLCMQLFNEDVVTVLKSIYARDSTSYEGQVAGASASLFEKIERYYFLMVEDLKTPFPEKLKELGAISEWLEDWQHSGVKAFAAPTF